MEELTVEEDLLASVVLMEIFLSFLMILLMRQYITRLSVMGFRIPIFVKALQNFVQARACTKTPLSGILLLLSMYGDCCDYASNTLTEFDKVLGLDNLRFKQDEFDVETQKFINAWKSCSSNTSMASESIHCRYHLVVTFILLDQTSSIRAQ